MTGFLPRTARDAAPDDHGAGLEQAAGAALGMGGRRFVVGWAFASDVWTGA